jgi:hypothetical protein
LPPLLPQTTPPTSVAPVAPAPAGVLLAPFVVPQPPAPPNQAQVAKRLSKAKEDAIAMRKHLWPDVDDDQLWLLSDKRKKGFSSMPRTMPILMNMIGDASKQVGSKSIPAGRTYLVLWCRVFGEGLVKIDNEMIAASEAGYVGERSISTWREHLRVLKELGFIDYRPGPAGPVQYILLLNPYTIAKQLRAKGWVSENQYTGLFQRAMDIGAGPDLAD